MTPQAPSQPNLDDLLTRYLRRRTEAQQQGVASFDVGEVTPYDAGPVQPIDAKMAWDEAKMALAVGTHSAREAYSKAPPSWAQLVATHEPVVALALCVGNFPQLVRNFHQISHKADLASLRPQAGRAAVIPGLEAWVGKAEASEKPRNGCWPWACCDWPSSSRRPTASSRRTTRVFRRRRGAPGRMRRPPWSGIGATPRRRGNCGKRQEETVAVLFNRAMADLFLGRTEAARGELSRVIEQLPESSAWHHLAHLYLTLAQTPLKGLHYF